jgi:hypothetical protein
MARISGHKRLAALSGAALLAIGVTAIAFAGGAGHSEQTRPIITPTIEPEPTAIAVATVPPSYIAPAPPPKQPDQTRQELAPFGPVAAEPVRVHTGDGDCLNVRSVPGTTFQNNDPRTCVPEGFLLWLNGQAVEADGETWRYALGEGWVAARYLRPAPEAATGMGPFRSVTVSQSDGVETLNARVASDGAVAGLPAMPYAQQGIGSRPQTVSPDGRYGAYGREEGYVPTLTIADLGAGTAQKYPHAYPIAWSGDGKLLITVSRLCPQQCTWVPGWIDPSDGIVHEFETAPNSWYAMTWAPDGRSVVAATEGRQLVQAFLDGTLREILPPQPEGTYFGELSVSPDGTKVFSSTFLGPITVIDLATGERTLIERAVQQQIGGRCGGSSGKLSAWLDASHLIWHESYALKGQNGITIASLADGSRRVIPFFSIQDLATVGPGLVSFVTWEYPPEKPGFQLTWLLDTATGEARPVTVGMGPVWERP